jgi:pyruvate kinase
MPDVLTPTFDHHTCAELIGELLQLRQSLLAHERELARWIGQAGHANEASARNLTHFLALRRHDLRDLQARLAGLGVSSLGRAETHVLANLDKVLGVLHGLAGAHWTPRTRDEPVGRQDGDELLQRHARALFGPPPPARATHIMVTMPSAAAHDPALVRALVDAGMDLARINCAHDDAAHWQAMAAHVRAAAEAAGRPVRVAMDLGGPKLRTGPIAGAVAVLKLKPARDRLGRVVAPARLVLRAAGGGEGAGAAKPAAQDAVIGVDAAWLATLTAGDRIATVDARGAQRRLHVVEVADGGHAAVAESRQTLYLTAESRLHRRAPRSRGQSRHGDGSGTAVTDLPLVRPHLLLHRGDPLLLRPEGLGQPALAAAEGSRARPAQIACTLPAALAALKVGDRVWFDDGRIGAVARRRLGRGMVLEVTEAHDDGERLFADKGINLPDTALDLPALTAKDIADLPAVARCADLVALSFAQSAQDVVDLRAALAAAGGAGLGLLLKIETQRGFERLPEMLMAAMAAPAAGVMIARGDLAVECGYERLAEVQEEILWACEAAHVPVVWATQVLESLAQTGRPSRAEITDAAMGVRAECVMLNKGPHVLQAMRLLDDILRRMQTHQAKKRPQMRALKAWRSLDGPASAPPLARPVDAIVA